MQLTDGAPGRLAPAAMLLVLGAMVAWHAVEVRPLMAALDVPFHLTLTPTRVGLFLWMAALVHLTADGRPAQPQLLLLLFALFAAAWMARETLVFSFLFGEQEGAAVLSCSAVSADRGLAGQTLLSKFVSSLMIGSGGLKTFDVPGAAKAAAAYDPLVAAWPLWGTLQPYFEILLGAAHMSGDPKGLVPMALTSGATAYGVSRALAEGRRPTCACAGTAVGAAPISGLTLFEYGLMCAVSSWQAYQQYVSAPPAATPLRRPKPPSPPPEPPRFERLDDD